MRERLRRQIIRSSKCRQEFPTICARRSRECSCRSRFPLHEAQKETLKEDIHDMNHMIGAYLEFRVGMQVNSLNPWISQPVFI